MFRLSLREIFFVLTLAGVLVGWWCDRVQIQKERIAANRYRESTTVLLRDFALRDKRRTVECATLEALMRDREEQLRQARNQLAGR